MYDVTVTTGNKFGAGTDANVFVRLIGEKGSTDEIQLQAKKTDLERGMYVLYISSPVGNEMKETKVVLSSNM